jgi:hypothetical protein
MTGLEQTERPGWRLAWVIDWQWARAMYESGMTLQELGRLYGLSFGSVGYHLKQVGTRMHSRGRPRGRRDPAPRRHRFDGADWKSAIAAYRAGATLRGIAKEMIGCSHETVRKELVRRGVEIRGKGNGHEQVEAPTDQASAGRTEECAEAAIAD